MSIQLIPFNEVRLSKDPNYLVQGLFPRTGLSVLWGPPKSGKTFWLFDLMTHVAANRNYRGRKVNGGSVVYCCFEGIEGYGARIGTDTAGDPITSCILDPCDDLPAAAVASKKLTAALEALEAVVGPDGAAEPAVWREEMCRRGVINRKSRNLRTAYKRIKDALVNTRQIIEGDDGLIRRSTVTPLRPIALVA
jgi:hypothetical protein